jgi:cobalamin-dependent methionine synthase I
VSEKNCTVNHLGAKIKLDEDHLYVVKLHEVSFFFEPVSRHQINPVLCGSWLSEKAMDSSVCHCKFFKRNVKRRVVTRNGNG